ncbi:hypothetical protein [Parasutterella excrementihominis]|uniref:hypothetical protein n=1 Tax=Parasutterella excrementihominis TaxID=487175 RepID=UPI0015658F65|nr:hypothetical protein [Parasutterella excrementihominis]
MNFVNAAGLHACREVPQVILSFPYSKKLLFSAVKAVTSLRTSCPEVSYGL